MRRSFLFCRYLGLTCWLGTIGLPMSLARGIELSLAAEVTQSQIFWTQAQTLSSDLLVSIAGIEQSIAARDPLKLLGWRDRLADHLNSTRQFLELRSPHPDLACVPTLSPLENPAAIATGFDPDELWVYCTLSLSHDRLVPVLDLLDRQITLADRPIFIPPSEQLEPPALGIPLKPPFSAAPLPPIRAIDPVPLNEFATPLESAKDLLTRSLEVFPPDFAVTLPEDALVEIYPEEAQPYTDFLDRPQTGLVRIVPSIVYNPYANPAGIAPSLPVRVPFTPLLEPETEGEFVDRLALQVSNENFQLVFPGINYGFMTDLGDVAIEDLDPALTNVSSLSPPSIELFLNYQPPREFAAIQEDRQRFIANKLDEFELSDPVAVQLPAQLNRTYLARSIQFDLPDLIVTGRALTPPERRILALLLETPSSDLLLAFRPIARRSDGSYLVLWRVLQEFPDPEILDLFRYVNAPDL